MIIINSLQYVYDLCGTLYSFIMFTLKFESNINFLLFLIFD